MAEAYSKRLVGVLSNVEIAENQLVENGAGQQSVGTIIKHRQMTLPKSIAKEKAVDGIVGQLTGKKKPDSFYTMCTRNIR